MTAERAARRIERLADQLPQAAERGLTELLGKVVDRAIWWSSGPLSSETLAAMGHPYARNAPPPPPPSAPPNFGGMGGRGRQRGARVAGRRGTARPDPGRINIQSGDLVRSWVVAPLERQGGTVRAAVYNASPEAAFLYDTRENPTWPDRGTRRMIGRPLPERVLKEIEPRAWTLIDRALDRALR